MKKRLLFLTTILLSFFCFENVLASTNTFVRNESDYKVRSDINITDSNKKNILLTPSVDSSEKIYDFADLLSNYEENNLFSSIENFISDTNYDLAVTTISKNNKNNAREYADDFYDYNNFGFNSSRDGILILIDMDTREIYISTSGYAIKMYSDSRIDSIIDSGYNYLKSGNYYECLDRIINRMMSYYNNGFPSNNKNMLIDELGNPYYIRKIPYLMIILISSISSLIVSLILYFKTISKIKKQNTVTYINPNSSNIIKSDQFISTHTTKIRRETSSSGGSGSSFHSSSSGRSHGGGGRHF